jgi:hypothetical protein
MAWDFSTITAPQKHYFKNTFFTYAVGGWFSQPCFSVRSGCVLRRQNKPVFMQHCLNRLAEPQGQGSKRPSFSSSSLLPCTTRKPRLTRVSDGNPLRRLLMTSKAVLFLECFVLAHKTPLSGSRVTRAGAIVSLEWVFFIGWMA